jgi:hypothetical protein
MNQDMLGLKGMGNSRDILTRQVNRFRYLSSFQYLWNPGDFYHKVWDISQVPELDVLSCHLPRRSRRNKWPRTSKSHDSMPSELALWLANDICSRELFPKNRPGGNLRGFPSEQKFGSVRVRSQHKDVFTPAERCGVMRCGQKSPMRWPTRCTVVTARRGAMRYNAVGRLTGNDVIWRNI